MQRGKVHYLSHVTQKLQRIFFLSPLMAILYSPLLQAAVPIKEIQSSISTHALEPPTSSQLFSLNANNLDQVLKELDPNSRYIPPPPPTSSLLKKKPRNFGIEIFEHKSTPWIRTIPDGPAFLAGLPEIGVLLAINNKNVSGCSLSQIATLIDKAMRNDKILIKVSDGLDGAVDNYSVSSAVHQTQAITWRHIDNHMILRINEFSTRHTAPALAAIYRVLIDQKTKVILDLRGSAGGDLYEALEIASMFVSARQPLVNTFDRDKTIVHYRSTQNQKLESPIGILIDSRTASSAEILTGILKFYRLSSVVGDKSYGKCTSTTAIPLSNGGKLWLTNRGVRFPDNSSCSGTGIQPDIKIPDISVLRLSVIIEKAFGMRH